MQLQANSMTFGAVLINYNYAQFLPDALQGLLRQTKAFDQIVVVDDCSTDASWSILEKYAHNYPQIELHRHPSNKGVCAAMNTGWPLIRTDYLALCASDDFLLPNFCHDSATLLDQHPAATLCFGASYFWNIETENAFIHGHSITQHSGYCSPDTLVEVDRLNRLTVYGNTCMVRTSVLRDRGGMNPLFAHGADTFIWISQIFSHGACYNNQPTGCVRIHSSTFSGSFRKKRDEHRKVVARILRAMRQPNEWLWGQRAAQSGFWAFAGLDVLWVCATHVDLICYFRPALLEKVARRFIRKILYFFSLPCHKTTRVIKQLDIGAEAVPVSVVQQLLAKLSAR